MDQVSCEFFQRLMSALDHVLVRLMPAKLREADAADLVLLWTLDPRFAKEI